MKKIIVVGSISLGKALSKKLHEGIGIVNETTEIDEPEPMTLKYIKIADEIPVNDFVHKSKYHK